MRRRPEAALEVDVLSALGGVEGLALYKNEVGKGYYGIAAKVIEDALKHRHREALRIVEGILNRHRVTYGLGVGSPDIVGALCGRAVCFELKADGYDLSEEQKRWHAAARERGVFVEVIRSPRQARETIERLLEEWR